MSAASHPAIESYSLLDPAIQSDPYAFYDLLRAECPVYRMPETEMYVVTRYEDAREVLRDTETFSSVVLAMSALQQENADLYQEILREKGWEHVHVLHRSDPPEHSRYRKLVDRVFTKRQARDIAPRVVEVANELVDTLLERGECEFVTDFAVPVPGIIMCEQLGLDKSEVHRFQSWADAMLATSNRIMDEEELRATAAIELDAQHHLARVFEERRREPTQDLISGLVHAHREGEEPFSMHELQNLMHQMITGGFETTPSAMSHGLHLLMQHPDQCEALRQDRSLMGGFVDETLRVESPVQGLMRTVTKDTEIAGTKLPEGAIVIVRYGAANRDPKKFSEPEKFDIRRPNASAHLAFGLARHFCVGAPLVRQEMEIAFDLILDRMENIELTRPLPDPKHVSSLNFYCLKELPIRFTERVA